MAYYQQAVNEHVGDVAFWEALFIYFFSPKGHNEECLYSLQQYEALAKDQKPEDLQKFGHCLKVWQGWLFDLLGRRDEAIKCYQEVLQNFKGPHGYCTQVDRKWLEEHIKTPFKLAEIGL